ncbi:autotransporter-associated beta strand repeat-containing protein, partial [Escherichia coli]|uniref:autotransporter-associated beta strand repeat-containing protein n=1 Tax=Escherichia coli TaxID=562 RepID=UPI003B9F8429
SGANTYTGATTIGSGATLALSGNGSIAASGNVIDNGAFSIAATNAGAAIQSLSGNGSVDLGSKTLALVNASGTFAGTIGGAGGLVKNGAGIQGLTGVNVFTGGVTLNAGGLLLGNG